MRKVGELADARAARRFATWLDHHGGSDLRGPDDGVWSIWVIDDQQTDAARAAFAAFQVSPADARWNATERVVAPPPPVAARDTDDDYPWVSAALIGASLLVAGVTRVGSNLAPAELLFLGSPDLHEILGGEVWRIWTPAFIHLSVMHLLFNMQALWRFGQQIELTRGRATLGALFVTIGAVSHLAQGLLDTPYFGGMSGVLYGLFGYVWARSRRDPFGGLLISQDNVMMMLFWGALCFSGLLGPIANTAHLVGMLVGGAIGLIEPKSPGGRVRFN